MVHKAEDKFILTERQRDALLLARRYTDEQGIWRPHFDFRNLAKKLSSRGFLNTLGANEHGGRFCYRITNSGRAALEKPLIAEERERS